MPSVTVSLVGQDQISDVLVKIADSMGKVNDVSLKMGDGMDKAAISAEKLQQAQLQTAISAEKLQQAQLQTALAAEKLEEAQEKANKSNQEGEGFANQFAEALFKIPTPAEAAAEAVKKIGEFALEALETSIEEAAKFDQQLTNLAAAAGIDKTSQAFEDLGNAALEVGKKTQYSSDVAIQGFQELRNKGLEAQDIIGVSLPAAYLAEMQGAKNMTDASKTLASSLNAFKLSAQDAQHMADEQAKAFQQTGLTTKDFGDAIKNAGAIAQATKQSFESMTAALEVQKTAGIDGARASVNYRQAISSLIKPNQQAGEMISNLGLQVRGADGNLKDYGDIVAEVTAKTANLDPASRQLALTTIFGKQGFIAMTDAMNATVKVHDELGERVLKGAEAIRYYEKSLKDADGTTEEMANTMRQSLEMQFQTLMGSVKELEVQFGKVFLPGLAKITEGAGQLVNELIEKVAPIEKDLTPKITEAFQILWDTVHPIFEGLISGIGKVYDVFKPSIDEIFKVIEDNKGTFENLGKEWGEELPLEMQAFAEAAKPVIDTIIKIADLVAKLIPVIDAVANPLGFVIGKWDEMTGKGKEVPPTIDAITKSMEANQVALEETTSKVEGLKKTHSDAQKSFDDLAKSGTASADQLKTASDKLADSNKALGEAQAKAKLESDNFNKGLEDLKKQAAATKEELAKMDKELAQGNHIDTAKYAKLTQEEQQLTATIKKEKASQAAASKDAAKVGLDAASESDDAQADSAEDLSKKQKAALEKIQEAQQSAAEKTADLTEKTNQKILDIEAKKNEAILSANDKLSQDLEKYEDDKVKAAQSTADKIAGINNSLLDKELSFADQRKSAEEKANEEIVKIQNDLKNATFKNADEKRKAEQKAADDIKLINLKLADDKAHIDRQDSAEQQKAARDKVAAEQKAQQDIAGIDQKEAQAKQKTQTDIEKIQAKAKTDSEKAADDQKLAQDKIQRSLDDTVAKNQDAANGINDSQQKVNDGANTAADGVDQANQKMSSSTADHTEKIKGSHKEIVDSASAMSDAVGKALEDAISKMSSSVSSGLSKLDSDFNSGMQKMVDTANANGQKIVSAVDKTTEAVKKSADTIVSGLGSIISHGNDAIVGAITAAEAKEEAALNKLIDKIQAAKDKAAQPLPGPSGGGDSSSSSGSSSGGTMGMDPGGSLGSGNFGLGKAGGTATGGGKAPTGGGGNPGAIGGPFMGGGNGSGGNPNAQDLGGPFMNNGGFGANNGQGGGGGGTHTTNVYLDGQKIAAYTLDMNTQQNKQHLGAAGYAQ